MKISDLLYSLHKAHEEHGNIEVIVTDPLGHLNVIETDDEAENLSEAMDWTKDFAVVTQPYQREEGPETVCLLIPHPDKVIFGEGLRETTKVYQ